MTLLERGLRFRYMITKEAQRRAGILTFWRKYGLEAAKEAYQVSRSTLFDWRKTLKVGYGKLESLNPKSKTPKNKRKRAVDPRIKEYIISQRAEHPRLSKGKLAKLLLTECAKWRVKAPGESTVGRIMADLKEAGKLPAPIQYSFYARTGNLIERKPPKKRKKLRRKGYQPTKEGDLLQLDTIVFFINGIRRYIVTAIDLKSDFAFAYGYAAPSSADAADFFKKLESVVPFKIKRIQTDNGSEFEKHFREYIEKQNIVHFHNYPKCPKMNAYVERFNRTIQEEFANRHKYLLASDLNRFNYKLMEWLLWYNTERPHWSLKLQSPMQFIISNFSFPESRMRWTNTGV